MEEEKRKHLKGKPHDKTRKDQRSGDIVLLDFVTPRIHHDAMYNIVLN